MKKLLIFLLIFISYFNAMAQTKKVATSYKYIDGSNNMYIINSKNIEYVPITPENSSSGIYSGGKAFNVEISAEQSAEIIKLVSDAIKNQDVQLETRPKGSGTIIKITNNVSEEMAETTTLKVNGLEKLAIEKWLKSLN